MSSYPTSSLGAVATLGFETDSAGVIVRNSAAEETEVAEDELKEDICASKEVGPLGRGRRAKIGSTRYGAEWKEQIDKCNVGITNRRS
jgi:hypothetical protein